MKFRKLLPLLPLGLAALPAFAADLLSVYQDALGYDAQFSASRSALEANRERLPQARSGLLPTIGVGASTTWNENEVTPRTSAGSTSEAKYNSNGWTATLTQPLFRWQNWASYQQGKLSVVAAEAQFRAAEQDLIVRVAQAYFDVLLAQESLATARAQLKAIAEQLAAAKRNFEVGTATITDTHEAQASYDLATAAEIAARNDLMVKNESLRLITGKGPETLKTLRSGTQIGSPQPDDIEQWANNSQTNSPLVIQAQAAFDIADTEIGKQRSGHLPTIDLVATHGRAGAGYASSIGTGIDSKTTTVGVQLSLPVFAGGAVMSKDREAVALREKARADLENARRQSALGARQAYLGVTSGLSQVKAYEAALASSQASLDSNKLGYEVGVRINIDVLNAQSQLFDTQRKLMKARFDTLIAQLRLKAAAGNLAEEDLRAVNALLD
jgi:outer membrane protein